MTRAKDEMHLSNLLQSAAHNLSTPQRGHIRADLQGLWQDL